jgi:hypothetical protein
MHAMRKINETMHAPFADFRQPHKPQAGHADNLKLTNAVGGLRAKGASLQAIAFRYRLTVYNVQFHLRKYNKQSNANE